MIIGEAITVLEEMNKWRQSLPPYDSDIPGTMPYSPKEFTEALDLAIELLKIINNKPKITSDCYDRHNTTYTNSDKKSR